MMVAMSSAEIKSATAPCPSSLTRRLKIGQDTFVEAAHSFLFRIVTPPLDVVGVGFGFGSEELGTVQLTLGSDIYSNYSSLQVKNDSLQINHYRSSKLQRQESYF